MKIVNDSAIGVVRLDRLLGGVDLPKGIEDLLRLRTDALLEAVNGDHAVRVLCAAAYQGNRIESALLDSIAREDPTRGVEELLLARRFAAETEEGLAFVHKNIQKYLLGRLRQAPTEERRLVASLLRDSGVIARLHEVFQGELAYWALGPQAAKPLFDVAVDRLVGLETRSASHLEQVYLDVRHSLLEFASETGRSRGERAKLHLAFSFLCVHFKSPLLGAEMAAEALRDKSFLDGAGGDRDPIYRAMKQQFAHASINAGNLLPALPAMKELEVSVPFTEDSDLEFATRYDLYNRLYDVNFKWNHSVVASGYVALAREVLVRWQASRQDGGSGDDKQSSEMLKCLRDDCAARLSMQEEPSVALALLLDSVERWDGVAPERNLQHNVNSLLVARAMVSREDPAALREVLLTAEEQYTRCSHIGAPGLTIRALLLIGVLTLMVENQDGLKAARKAVDAAINISLRAGYRTYLAFLYNTKAVLAMRQEQPSTDIDGWFRSMRAELSFQLGDFLGTAPPCFPSGLLISNHLYWISSKTPTDADGGQEDALTSALEQLVFYDSREAGGHGSTSEMAIGLLKSGSIYKDWPRRVGGGPLFDPVNGYWLPKT